VIRLSSLTIWVAGLETLTYRGRLFAVAFGPRMSKLRSLSSEYCYRYKKV